MSKLVEAEMDGAAAAKQVMALKDTIGKLKTVGSNQHQCQGGTGPGEGTAAGQGGVLTLSSEGLCDIPRLPEDLPSLPTPPASFTS